MSVPSNSLRKTKLKAASSLTPTCELSDKYQAIFDYFNQQLFDGLLPNCILDLNAKGKSQGFFKPKGWTKYDGQIVTSHQISLNPELLQESTSYRAYMTLVIQMLTLWQHEFGETKLIRPGYYNTEVLEKAESLGLVLQAKNKGWHVDCFVEPSGLFCQSLENMPLELYFVWKPKAETKLVTNKLKLPSRSKVKHHCSQCGQNIWGAASIKPMRCYENDCPGLICTESKSTMTDNTSQTVLH